MHFIDQNIINFNQINLEFYEESAQHKIDNIFQINLKSNYLIIL